MYFCAQEQSAHDLAYDCSTSSVCTAEKVSLRCTFVHKSRVHVTWHVTIVLALCRKSQSEMYFCAHC